MTVISAPAPPSDLPPGLSTGAVLTIITADFTDAAVILLVIVVNTTVGVVQEVKAERRSRLCRRCPRPKRK